jgi:polysaccharide export outer membrane protein
MTLSFPIANPGWSPRLRRLVACLLVALCWAVGTGTMFAQETSGAGVAGQGASSTAGAAATPAPPSVPTPMTGTMLYPGDDFTLSPGDLIHVAVFLQSDYQATVRLSAEGAAELPFIGSVPLQGLTVRAAQALIADRLRAGGFYRDPEVTIQVMDTVNGSVTITGEVRSVVPVANQRSLKEVLLLAGGLPPNASHTIKIVRPGEPEPIVVDLGTDLASSTTANVFVHPHDIIQITRASVVYVLGAFGHQGAVPLDQSSPLTLLQLTALSGGLNFEGKYDDLRIIRTVGTERKVVEVDIKKVRDGTAPDPVLQANDIILLPTNTAKAVVKNLGVGGVFGLISILIAAHAY